VSIVMLEVGYPRRARGPWGTSGIGLRISRAQHRQMGGRRDQSDHISTRWIIRRPGAGLTCGSGHTVARW